MRYFFDVLCSGIETRDDDGVELRTHDAALREAVNILTAVARDEISPTSQPRITVQIRDEKGVTLYRTDLNILFDSTN